MESEGSLQPRDGGHWALPSSSDRVDLCRIRKAGLNLIHPWDLASDPQACLGRHQAYERGFTCELVPAIGKPQLLWKLK